MDFLWKGSAVIQTSDGLRRMVIVEGPTVVYTVQVLHLDGSPTDRTSDGAAVEEVWEEPRLVRAISDARPLVAAMLAGARVVARGG